MMLGMFDVCLMFRHSMFRVFEVWYFGVRSKTSSKPECAMWVCHESVSVGVVNQGLGAIRAINRTMGG